MVSPHARCPGLRWPASPSLSWSSQSWSSRRLWSSCSVSSAPSRFRLHLRALGMGAERGADVGLGAGEDLLRRAVNPLGLLHDRLQYRTHTCQLDRISDLP